MREAGAGFAIWFAFCTLVSLATTAFILWGVYRLVIWLTAQSF